MWLTALVLGVLGYFVWSLLQVSPAPKGGVYRQPGQWYLVKKVLFYILFQVRKWQRRLGSQQDSVVGGGASGYGIRSQPAIESMERVYSLLEHPQALDAVYFAGFSEDGTSVVCRVGRRRDRRAEVWLFLEIPGVGCLQHPVHPDTLVCNTDGASFTAGGLRVEMCEPMRTWRLSYSGPLRKGLSNSLNKDGGEFVHVKFSFLWKSFNDPFDYDVDVHPWCISDAIARETWTQQLWEELKSTHQSHYEQWGELRGRLMIEGAEGRSVRVKCVRDHTHGVRDWNSLHRYVVHFIYIETGMTLQCGIISIPGNLSHLMVGYLSYPNGETVSVSHVSLDMMEVGEYTSPPDQYNFSIMADGKSYWIEVEGRTSPVWYHGDDRGGKVVEKLCNVSVNSQRGFGVAEFFYRNPDGPAVTSPEVSLPLVTRVDDDILQGRQSALVLPFTDQACCSSQLVGGKGAQLAQLTKIQETLGVCVPKGFCVTTFAYQQHLKSSRCLSSVISKVSDSHLKGDQALRGACDEINQVFKQTDITSDIKDAITKELSQIWGDEVETTRYAVRSSASGEDGSESSTAGQLDTYLGLIGSRQVLEAVVKCWASAYTFQAVQYRKQQGQQVGVAVGVVIQEMVAAEVAGVLFTKDPVTDNPSMMVINSNYGLGESVVSGVSDVDTIRIERRWDGHMTVHSKDIGQKTSLMTVSEGGGVKTTSVESHMTSSCCLTDDIILKLGSIGIQHYGGSKQCRARAKPTTIRKLLVDLPMDGWRGSQHELDLNSQHGNIDIQLEKHYGSERDVEWALKQGQIYLLQARPVTSQDLETDEDLIHEFDSSLASDHVWLTTGNIGEMMPGAVCPLTNSLFARSIDKGLQGFMTDCGMAGLCHHADKCVPCSCNHLFINLHHIGNMYVNARHGEKSYVHISLLGEPLKELTLASVSLYVRPQGTLSRVWNSLSMFRCQWRAGKDCEMWDKRLSSYIPTRSGDAVSLYEGICLQLRDYDEVWKKTMIVSSKSGSWAVLMLSVLTGGSTDVKNEHFSDIASLLSNCSDVISVNVPHLLQILAGDIEKEGSKELFVSMTTEAATSWLQSPDSGVAGQKFADFLQEHGHRCIREAEMLEKSWRRQPEKLVKILQSMLKSSSVLNSTAEGTSVEEAIATLSSPLSWFGKQLLRFLLPRARAAVGYREWAKSLSIKMSDVMKESYWTLAECMVTEGRLPEVELLFFLTHYEIGKLLQFRSPRLINKAIRRRRIISKQMSLDFPKYSVGHPRPIQADVPAEQLTASLQLKGMPVSQGEITGTARVVRSVEDAGSIQARDILIVPYTDVGWSPYFPMIGGLVTEMGGLLSHGAVVAREYGLPCVVNVPGATSVFTSDGVLGCMPSGTYGGWGRLVMIPAASPQEVFQVSAQGPLSPKVSSLEALLPHLSSTFQKASDAKPVHLSQAAA